MVDVTKGDLFYNLMYKEYLFYNQLNMDETVCKNLAEKRGGGGENLGRNGYETCCMERWHSLLDQCLFKDVKNKHFIINIRHKM